MKVDNSTHYLNFVGASHELNAANRQQENEEPAICQLCALDEDLKYCSSRIGDRSTNDRINGGRISPLVNAIQEIGHFGERAKNKPSRKWWQGTIQGLTWPVDALCDATVTSLVKEAKKLKCRKQRKK